MADDGIRMAKVLFDFDTTEEGELSLKKGQFLTILDSSDESGWWNGVLVSTGEQGDFPFNYIEVIVPHEDDADDDSGTNGDVDAQDYDQSNISTIIPVAVAATANTTTSTTTSTSTNKISHQRSQSKPVLAHVSAENDKDGRAGHSFALSFREAGIETIDIVSTLLQLDSDQKKFTLYNVRVNTSDGNSRVAGKRYREFRALQKALKTTFPFVGQRLQHTLQSKMTDRLQHFRRFTDDVIEKRKIALQLYLHDLASMPSVSALLMAWLFQEKAEVEVARRATALGGGVGMLNTAASPNKKLVDGAMRKGGGSRGGGRGGGGGGGSDGRIGKKERANDHRIGRGIAIADWTGNDETEIDLWQGETYTLYKVLSNNYVEISDASGMRGIAPQKYFKMMNVPGGEGSETLLKSNSTLCRESFQEETMKKNQLEKVNLGGVEKFQLESCEAFDQLMNDGYAVEKKILSSEKEMRSPSIGDIVVVDLVGMLWDASQTFVTEFVRGGDLSVGDDDAAKEEDGAAVSSSSSSTTKTKSTRCVLTLGECEMTRGLDLALATMNVGEKSMCVITPDLAFGEVGEPKWDVPASVHVVFDVTLVSVQTVNEREEAIGLAADDNTDNTVVDLVPQSLSQGGEEGEGGGQGGGGQEGEEGGGGGNYRASTRRGNSEKHYSFAGQKGRKGRMVLVKELSTVDSFRNDDSVSLCDLTTDELMKRAAPMMGLEMGGKGGGGKGGGEKGGGEKEGGGKKSKKKIAPPPAPIGRTKTMTPPPVPANRLSPSEEEDVVVVVVPSRNVAIPPPVPKGRSVKMTTTTTTTLSYEELTTLNSDECAARNLDRKTLDVYLSKEEFQNIFKMNREAFSSLPGWKQKQKKIEAKLF